MKKSSGTWVLLHPCICQIAGKYKMKKMKDKSKRKKEKKRKRRVEDQEISMKFVGPTLKEKKVMFDN